MTDVRQLLTEALHDEPSSKLSVTDVTRRARRRAVLRRAGSVASGVLVVSASAGVLLAVHNGGTPRPAAVEQVSTTPTALISVSATHRATPRADDVITARSLPRIVEERGGLSLSSVTSQNLDNTSYVDLGGAIDSVDGRRAAGQYLNVQVFPKTNPDLRRSCAEMSRLDQDGDGYSGPCSIKTLSDGTYLVERSGTTAQGGYAITQATLIRADGSGVTAEVSNQKYEAGVHRMEPVVSDQPPVSSSALVDLVTKLAQLELRR